VYFPVFLGELEPKLNPLPWKIVPDFFEEIFGNWILRLAGGRLLAMGGGLPKNVRLGQKPVFLPPSGSGSSKFSLQCSLQYTFQGCPRENFFLVLKKNRTATLFHRKRWCGGGNAIQPADKKHNNLCPSSHTEGASMGENPPWPTPLPEGG